MPDGNEINEQLEFIERIKAMPPDERSLETARLTYTLVSKVDVLDTKVTSLDTKFDDCISGNGSNKKTSAISGGVTGGIIATVIALIEYFKGR